jgi:hypothetical protein
MPEILRGDHLPDKTEYATSYLEPNSKISQGYQKDKTNGFGEKYIEVHFTVVCSDVYQSYLHVTRIVCRGCVVVHP